MTLRLADSFVDGSAFINLVRLYEAAAEGKKQRVTGGSGDLTESRHGSFRGLRLKCLSNVFSIRVAKLQDQ